MVKSNRGVLLSFLLAIIALPLSAKTWYVRPDGGTRYSVKAPAGQCDGKADARYPGSGVNRHCAYNDVRYLWDDGTLGNWGWVIAGGDTVVVEGCAASANQMNPSNPNCRIGYDNNIGNSATNTWCWYAPGGYGNNQGCHNPTIPAGTSAAHTRILGLCAYKGNCTPVNTYPYTGNLTQLFGGFGDQVVLNLSGTQYVDVQGLEITSHNGACVQYGSPAPKRCINQNPGSSDYANNGIQTDKSSANILLQDVYVHGLTASGLFGPIGGAITMTRVFVGFNGFAGWNFDDGVPTPDAVGSSIAASYVTMKGNGCDEQYPIVNSQFPAFACYDSNSGGFGDSWSGQDTTLSSFTCDHCIQAYNTKDGFIGPHTAITHLTITNSESYGNMGQQWKWGAPPNSTTIFANNLTIGNCRRMSAALPGAPSNYNRYLSLYCRADGDVFSFYSAAHSTVLFANNSTIGYSATMFDLNCQTKNTCGTTKYIFRNNISLGFLNPKYNPTNANVPGLNYFGDSSDTITADHDVYYNFRGHYCPWVGHPDLLCSNPLFVNQPPLTLKNESELDNFNFHLSAASPAIGHGIAVVGVPTDYDGATRSNPPSIGAFEPNLKPPAQKK